MTTIQGLAWLSKDTQKRLGLRKETREGFRLGRETRKGTRLEKGRLSLL